MKTNKLKAIACVVFFLTNFFFSHKSFSQPIVTVDERTEITSVLCRLAEFEEYSYMGLEKYVTEMHEYFDKFKTHPAVTCLKELRAKRGISFDAVPSLATRITKAPNFAPMDDIDNSGLDERWTNGDVVKFCGLLKAFYLDTRFQVFFNEHKPFYNITIRRFRDSVISKIDFTWYDKFFAYKPGKFNLILGMLNGFSNFNSTVSLKNGQEDLFAIVGVMNQDSAGFPVFTWETIPTVIHEFGHSYTNRIVLSSLNRLKPPAERIFPYVRTSLNKIGYNSPTTMLIESLLRACVIKYVEDNPVGNISKQTFISIEKASGFVWTDSFVNHLDRYKYNRNKYRSFKDFANEIAAFFEGVAVNIETYIAKMEEDRPRITRILPFQNFTTNVSDTVSEIRVEFNTPMLNRMYFSTMDAGMPLVTSPEPHFTEDGRTLIVKIKIQKGKDYGFLLTYDGFYSATGLSLKDSYPVYFSTKDFIPESPNEHYGYETTDSSIIFRCKKPVDLPQDVKTMKIAGEFNNWNPNTEGFTMYEKKNGIYELEVKKDRIGKPGARKMFKFVANDAYWIEPLPNKALNTKKDGAYTNLVLEIR
jgi:Domain of unknown function (DUF4932)